MRKSAKKLQEYLSQSGGQAIHSSARLDPGKCLAGALKRDASLKRNNSIPTSIFTSNDRHNVMLYRCIQFGGDFSYQFAQPGLENQILKCRHHDIVNFESTNSNLQSFQYTTNQPSSHLKMPSFISIFAASTLSALVAAVPAPTGTEAGLPFWGKGNLEIIRDYKRIGCLGELGNVAFGNERCGVFFGDWQGKISSRHPQRCPHELFDLHGSIRRVKSRG